GQKSATAQLRPTLVQRFDFAARSLERFCLSFDRSAECLQLIRIRELLLELRHLRLHLEDACFHSFELTLLRIGLLLRLLLRCRRRRFRLELLRLVRAFSIELDPVTFNTNIVAKGLKRAFVADHPSVSFESEDRSRHSIQ